MSLYTLDLHRHRVQENAARELYERHRASVIDHGSKNERCVAAIGRTIDSAVQSSTARRLARLQAARIPGIPAITESTKEINEVLLTGVVSGNARAVVAAEAASRTAKTLADRNITAARAAMLRGTVRMGSYTRNGDLTSPTRVLSAIPAVPLQAVHLKQTMALSEAQLAAADTALAPGRAMGSQSTQLLSGSIDLRPELVSQPDLLYGGRTALRHTGVAGLPAALLQPTPEQAPGLSHSSMLCTQYKHQTAIGQTYPGTGGELRPDNHAFRSRDQRAELFHGHVKLGKTALPTRAYRAGGALDEAKTQVLQRHAEAVGGHAQFGTEGCARLYCTGAEAYTGQDEPGAVHRASATSLPRRAPNKSHRAGDAALCLYGPPLRLNRHITAGSILAHRAREQQIAMLERRQRAKSQLIREYDAARRAGHDTDAVAQGALSKLYGDEVAQALTCGRGGPGPRRTPQDTAAAYPAGSTAAYYFGAYSAQEPPPPSSMHAEGIARDRAAMYIKRAEEHAASRPLSSASALSAKFSTWSKSELQLAQGLSVHDSTELSLGEHHDDHTDHEDHNTPRSDVIGSRQSSALVPPLALPKSKRSSAATPALLSGGTCSSRQSRSPLSAGGLLVCGIKLQVGKAKATPLPDQAGAITVKRLAAGSHGDLVAMLPQSESQPDKLTLLPIADTVQLRLQLDQHLIQPQADEPHPAAQIPTLGRAGPVAAAKELAGWFEPLGSSGGPSSRQLAAAAEPGEASSAAAPAAAAAAAGEKRRRSKSDKGDDTKASKKTPKSAKKAKSVKKSRK